MAGKVVLIERIGRLQTFNLPHHEFCEAHGSCICQDVIFRKAYKDRRTGVMRAQPVRRRVSQSITLLPRTRSEPLPRAVLECSEVKAALRSRPLRLRYVEAGE